MGGFPLFPKKFSFFFENIYLLRHSEKFGIWNPDRAMLFTIGPSGFCSRQRHFQTLSDKHDFTILS